MRGVYTSAGSDHSQSEGQISQFNTAGLSRTHLKGFLPQRVVARRLERLARMEAAMYGAWGRMLETTQFGGRVHPNCDGTLYSGAPWDSLPDTDTAIPQEPPQSSG